MLIYARGAKGFLNGVLLLTSRPASGHNKDAQIPLW
jgi:hypothetical protein